MQIGGWIVAGLAGLWAFVYPEFKPDVEINGDLKPVFTSRAPASSKAQVKNTAIGHMRKLSKLPDHVGSFFGHNTFRYAARSKITQAGSTGSRLQLCSRRNAGSPCWILPGATLLIHDTTTLGRE